MNSLPPSSHFSTRLTAQGGTSVAAPQAMQTTLAHSVAVFPQTRVSQIPSPSSAPSDFRQALPLSSRTFLPWTLQTNAASQPHYFLHLGPVEKGGIGKIKGLSATWGTPLSKASALLLRLLNFDKGTLEWARLEDENAPATAPQPGLQPQTLPQPQVKPVVKASLVTVHPEQTKLGRWLLGSLSSKGPAEPLAPVALMSCPAAPPTQEGKLHLKTLIVQTRQQLQKTHPDQRVYALVPQEHVPAFLETGFKLATSTATASSGSTEPASQLQSKPSDPIAAFLQKHFENDSVQLLTFNA